MRTLLWLHLLQTILIVAWPYYLVKSTQREAAGVKQKLDTAARSVRGELEVAAADVRAEVVVAEGIVRDTAVATCDKLDEISEHTNSTLAVAVDHVRRLSDQVIHLGGIPVPPVRPR